MTAQFNSMLPSQLRKLVVERELVTVDAALELRKAQLLAILSEAEEAATVEVEDEEPLTDMVEDEDVLPEVVEEDEDELIEEVTEEEPVKAAPSDGRTKSAKAREIIREYMDNNRPFTSGHIMQRYESAYGEKIHRSFVTTLINKEKNA